jgi:hypothetical protein
MSLYGQQIKQEELSKDFLSGPGEVLVPKFIQALASVKPFTELFGPYTKPKDPNTRWADYPRFDWSNRQLPAINIYEKEPEEKSSSNAWLLGTIGIQVFWPASFRRSDLSRIPRTFSAALLNFLESDAAYGLFPLVPGLNEFGRNVVWTPNVEGMIESELVPVTMVEVKYRVDLRAWYRFLELDSRTKGLPFERTLAPWDATAVEIDGVIDDPEVTEVVVESEIPVEPEEEE